jgi:DNA-directed RNA polymerase specialized sigma24 family protein
MQQPVTNHVQHDYRMLEVAEEGELSRLDIHRLAGHCAQQSEHFFRGRPSDQRFSYELFRRALVDGDQQAWNYVYQLYSPLVDGWVRRSTAFNSTGESSEYFVAAAFTKFWRAVSPERFASFPTLGSLLHYLQLCAGSVVIDSVRSNAWGDMLPQEAASEKRVAQHSPDEEALSRVARTEFWRLIDQYLNSQQERVVIYASFVLGMNPREIYGRRGDLFADVREVYSVKRNVLARLSRNQHIRRLATMEGDE